MRQVYLGLVVCLAGGACLEASPFTSVDANTTCIPGRSQQFCTLTTNLLGPTGMALPATLADITMIAAITGEIEAPQIDRSAELTADLFSDENYAPLVVGPQMFTSIQLSFDSRIDIGARRTGAEAFSDLRRQALAARKGSTLDTLQVELTLGTAMTTLDMEKSVSVRTLGKSDYVSFALVNQAHVSAQPVPAPVDDTEAGEEEASLQ